MRTQVIVEQIASQVQGSGHPPGSSNVHLLAFQVGVKALKGRIVDSEDEC